MQMFVDDHLNGTAYIPSKLCNVWIGKMQASARGCKSSFGNPIQLFPLIQNTDRTAISKCQFSDFALLSEVAVDTVFLNGNAEHLACVDAIDVFFLGKYFGMPGFVGKACKDSGFNGEEVTDNELVPRTWNEGFSD